MLFGVQDWGVVQRYRRDRLVAERGDLGVQVSDIPYAVKFGGSGQVDMSLGQYVQQMQQHKVLGGAHPWYVFKGHPIPRASEDAHTSLVPVEDCPTPAVLQEAFNGAAKTAPAGGGSPERGRCGVWCRGRGTLSAESVRQRAVGTGQ